MKGSVQEVKGSVQEVKGNVDKLQVKPHNFGVTSAARFVCSLRDCGGLKEATNMVILVMHDEKRGVLVCKPVGEAVRPASSNTVVVSLRQLAQLVSIVKKAHGLKLVHRDITPFNVYVVKESAGTSGGGGGSTRLLLSDWGGSKHVDTTEAHGQGHASVGTKGYAVAEEELSWEQRDLLSLVYTCFSIHTGLVMGEERMVWEESKGGLWEELEGAAREGNYDRMRKLLTMEV